MNRVSEILQSLKKRKNSVSCYGKSGLLMYMVELGFLHKDGKTAGHRIFTHKSLTDLTMGEFRTHSIDCGHAPKRPMKKPYVISTIKMIEKYQIELSEILGARL